MVSLRNVKQDSYPYCSGRIAFRCCLCSFRETSSIEETLICCWPESEVVFKKLNDVCVRKCA